MIQVSSVVRCYRSSLLRWATAVSNPSYKTTTEVLLSHEVTSVKSSQKVEITLTAIAKGGDEAVKAASIDPQQRRRKRHDFSHPNSPSRTPAASTPGGLLPSSTPVGRKRGQRPSFMSLLNSIPSFKDFQIQQQVRSLYRQFLRLARGPEGPELRRQIRHEFRVTSSSAERWEIQRALSEGGRRHKELATMLGSSVVTTPKTASQVGEGPTSDNGDFDRSGSRGGQWANLPKSAQPASSAVWPWQRKS
jgi:hypothetical protein